MAELATTLMKSRRRIAFSKAQDRADLQCNYSRDLQVGEIGSEVNLPSSNFKPPMSARGHRY
jgi:hypothetical protein